MKFQQNLSIKEDIQQNIKYLVKNRQEKFIEHSINYIYQSKNELFQKKIIENLFQYLDDCYSHDENKNKKEQSVCLTILTILSEKFIEEKNFLMSNFVTSHMLSRSQHNSFIMRISLLHYFTQIAKNEKIQIQKIIDRFGYSLIDNILEQYFSMNENSAIAFKFLDLHLHVFFQKRQHGESMIYNALKKQMLKHPHEFVDFIKRYSTANLKKLDHDSAINFIEEICQLLKKSLVLKQKYVHKSLSEILLTYLNIFDDRPNETLEQMYLITLRILNDCKAKQNTEIIQTIGKELKKRQQFIEKNSKIIHLNFRTKNNSPNDESNTSHLKNLRNFMKLCS